MLRDSEKEHKPALQCSHSLSKEPPMTPTFRENNAQGKVWERKKVKAQLHCQYLAKDTSPSGCKFPASHFWHQS